MDNYVTEQSAGDIISNTFKIYREHLVTLCLIYVAPVLPFSILTAFAISSGDMLAIGLTNILEINVSYFALGAMTVAISDICVGNRPSFTRSYGMLWRVIGRYIVVYLLTTLIVAIGFLLLVVPGLIAMVLLMFTLTCVILERQSGMGAVKRSIALGKGHYWRNFGIYLLAVVVVFVIQLIVLVIIAFLFFGGDFEAGIGLELINVIVAGLLGPLLLIPIVLLYYDMRVQKEHFDSSALSQDLLV